MPISPASYSWPYRVVQSLAVRRLARPAAGGLMNEYHDWRASVSANAVVAASPAWRDSFFTFAWLRLALPALLQRVVMFSAALSILAVAAHVLWAVPGCILLGVLIALFTYESGAPRLLWAHTDPSIMCEFLDRHGDTLPAAVLADEGVCDLLLEGEPEAVRDVMLTLASSFPGTVGQLRNLATTDLVPG